jgi:hypothetical protein
MIKAILGQLINDSIHGGVLKSISLLARALFFVLVVPILGAGELAGYMYINSTALILSTIAILGLNEELPRVIAGNLGIARGYFKWFVSLNTVATLLLIVTLLLPSNALAILLFAFTALAGRFLNGVVRSLNPAVFEQIQNVPWVLFLICAATLRLDNAVELIIARSASMCLVQWYAFRVISRSKRQASSWEPTSLPAIIRRGLSRGISKLGANLLLLGVVRGPVILPVWLGLGGNLDTVAFAVAVGEMIVQFGIIPVNRAYAKWCRSIPTAHQDWVQTVTTCLALVVGLSAVSLLAVFILGFAEFWPSNIASSNMLSQASVFYSLVVAFYLVRYLVWSRGILEYEVILLSALMFIATVGIVLTIDMQFWFLSLALVFAITISMLARLAKGYFARVT